MPRLLLVEGNTLERQQQAVDRGARSPGMVYQQTLARHFPEIEVDRVHAAEPGNPLPDGYSLTDYTGLVIGGSGLHAYDTADEVVRQIELLRAFAATGGPIIGCCWGLQIAVIAAGGAVRRSPNGREIVIARKIRLNREGLSHPLYAGKPDVFDAPCIHYDEIAQLPADARLLCSNEHSDVQGAIIPLGNSEVWGVQYHPEFDLQHLTDIVRLFGDEMINEGVLPSSAEKSLLQDRLSRLTIHPEDSVVGRELEVGQDISDDSLRSKEVINWVRHCVLA